MVSLPSSFPFQTTKPAAPSSLECAPPTRLSVHLVGSIPFPRALGGQNLSGGVDPRSSQTNGGRAWGWDRGVLGARLVWGPGEVLGLEGGQGREQRMREGQGGA